MNDQSRLGIRALARAARYAATTLAITGLGAVGCLNRPIEPVEVRTTSVVVEQLTENGVNKIDLLLAIDNSASMADKQAILAEAVPDLITGLVNPACVDQNGNPSPTQPTGPTDKSCGSAGCSACPSGFQREFPPVLDIHIGLISSSLGSFGADGCPDKPSSTCMGTPDTTPLDDHGHLVTRSDSCDSKGPIPTYQNEGFLAWDPGQTLMPPGILTIGMIGTGGPGTGSGIVGSLHDLVVGNGQEGCGFESQNESWYRFLVDPTPYQTITLVNNQVQTAGIDTVLLQQRAEFMRPDSLLAIILLSDETDVSIKEFSSYPLFAAPELHLPHASAACTTNGPKDPCCYSCGQGTPKGCTADPMCASNEYYTAADENTSLRAFGLISHKQRYGIEFMYQPSRYVNALTLPKIADNKGNMVDNPIYSNLNKMAYTGAIRGQNLVFYAAIVGVPWQLIARQNAKGQPDLINGVAPAGVSPGGFKTASELAELDPKGNVFWDDIAGDPENYVIAKSPFMVESTVPRMGTDPITGAAISPTTTPNGGGSKAGVTSTDPTGMNTLLNDHEWTIPTPPGDIEYACVFPLATGIDESANSMNSNLGDCGTNPKDNPLCSPNMNDPVSGSGTCDPNTAGACKNTLQTKAKAYPGIKHLAIARGMGAQGIAASICPAQLTDNTKADYGYRPAVRAIIDRLKQALGGECLPRELTEDPTTGQVQCLILEGTKVAGACPPCSSQPARGDVPMAQQPAVDQALATIGNQEGLNCFCEIEQVSNAAPTTGALTDCQTNQSTAAGTNGWCYVDAAVNSSQAKLVSKCPLTEQHDIRFVGKGAPQAGATLFITCAGD